jgi:hypothetical protein
MYIGGEFEERRGGEFEESIVKMCLLSRMDRLKRVNL